MFKHVDRALTSLANSEVRISLLGSIRMGCDALVVLGPVVMGIFALPTFAPTTWSTWVVGGSAAAAFLGFVGSKASILLDDMSRRKIDIDHSDDITASLGALHRVLLDQDDPARMRQLLLGSIASTVNRVCPQRGAQVFAGLLLPQGDQLVLIDYSRFREGKVPSASFPLNHPEGSPRAFRDRALRYVADTADPAVKSSFTGRRFRSLLAFPIVDGEVCVGVVAVDSNVPHHFDKHLAEIDAHVSPFVGVLQLNLTCAASRAARRRAKVAR